jgi:hypothetical protein
MIYSSSNYLEIHHIIVPTWIGTIASTIFTNSSCYCCVVN